MDDGTMGTMGNHWKLGTGHERYRNAHPARPTTAIKLYQDPESLEVGLARQRNEPGRGRWTLRGPGQATCSGWPVVSVSLSQCRGQSPFRPVPRSGSPLSISVIRLLIQYLLPHRIASRSIPSNFSKGEPMGRQGLQEASPRKHLQDLAHRWFFARQGYRFGEGEWEDTGEG